MPVNFRVLGGVEAEVHGRPLRLGHARQQCVLVALLVDANQPVSADRLASRVWGADHPNGNTLHTYVSRLRRVLADADGVGLLRHGNGYVMTVAPSAVDLHRFGQLLATARASRDDAAAQVLFEQALALWRGEAFANLDTAWIGSVRESLTQQRFAAELDLTDVLLRRGEHAALLAQLSDRARAHQFDERVCAQLMLAQFRCGRTRSALDGYQAIRRRLAEELGVDPGPELQSLYRQILNADPAVRAPTRVAVVGRGTAPVPGQLPASPLMFTGRVEELAELTRSLPTSEPGTGLPIVVIHGAAGVGKTWLALRWAHAQRPAFPDGQLYANLQGFGPAEPVDPADVLSGFLCALGVPVDRIPAALDARTGLFRSVLGGRRVLVLLDNARDVGQVRPLLPGEAGCLVLVTSRDQLAGLVASEGAHPLGLGLPSEVDARAMLARRLGADRVSTEPDAVDGIIAGCARLPIALAVTAARAATNPALSLATVAAQLRDATAWPGFPMAEPATDVRAVLSWSYRTLSPDAARLFRWLGLCPTTDFGPAAAASLLGRPASLALAPLAELTRVHLLDEDDTGRYRLHDLVGAYARERARTEDTDADRDAAQHRLLDHYLHTAHLAARLLSPTRDHLALAPPGPGVTVAGLADRGQAMRWYSAEHAALRAVVTQAPGGRHDHVWRLAPALGTYLDRQGHVDENAVVQAAAFAAARTLGDRHTLARAHRDLGHAMILVDRWAEAEAHNNAAVKLFADVGDGVGGAGAYRNLAWIAGHRGNLTAAIAHARRSLHAYRSAGCRAGEAGALNNVGWYLTRSGRHAPALRLCRQALTLFLEYGDRQREASTWDSLGRVHFRLDEPDRGMACYERAIEIFHEIGDRHSAAVAFVNLSKEYERIGRADAAHGARHHALTLLEELDFPVRAAPTS